mgnify:CR=1 FL=1
MTKSLDWVSQTTGIDCSPFWRLEVRDQGASVVMLPGGPASQLVDGSLLAMPSGGKRERVLVSLPLLIRALIPSCGPHHPYDLFYT